MMHSLPPGSLRRRARGLSLIELLVSMALGLALIAILLAAYDSSRTASKRQAQLTDIQNNIRTAFEYISTDGRMIGHQGCYTRKAPAPVVAGLDSTKIATNYVLGVYGYDASLGTDDSSGKLTLTGANPTNDTSAGNWKKSSGADVALSDVAMAEISGEVSAGTAIGLTPYSDVLVMRSVVGRPLRLLANTAAKATKLSIEDTGTKCSSGATSVSGLCAGSHLLIASCANAQFTAVGAVGTGGEITLPTAIELKSAYEAASTEVFPVQTVAYYLKRGSAGTSPSLYRRVFDGAGSTGNHEEELVPGVETLQVRYGVEAAPVAPATTSDGIVKSWERGNDVTNWDRVVAIRVSLLLRSETTSDGAIAQAATGTVNDVTVVYPTSTPLHDRQVFTTTVAIRNRISY